jgi:hypothetical protein
LNLLKLAPGSFAAALVLEGDLFFCVFVFGREAAVVAVDIDRNFLLLMTIKNYTRVCGKPRGLA